MFCFISKAKWVCTYNKNKTTSLNFDLTPRGFKRVSCGIENKGPLRFKNGWIFVITRFVNIIQSMCIKSAVLIYLQIFTISHEYCKNCYYYYYYNYYCCSGCSVPSKVYRNVILRTLYPKGRYNQGLWWRHRSSLRLLPFTCIVYLPLNKSNAHKNPDKHKYRVLVFPEDRLPIHAYSFMWRRLRI